MDVEEGRQRDAEDVSAAELLGKGADDEIVEVTPLTPNPSPPEAEGEGSKP